MKVINKLTKEQYKELQRLYIAFFNEINFDHEYSDKSINLFAKKKIKDAKRVNINQQFFYIQSTDELIGFTHGKIIDNIGLICHTYVKNEYRNTSAYALLQKSLVKWFKSNNISIMESEISKSNPIITKVHKTGWKVYEEFPDSLVLQKKL